METSLGDSVWTGATDLIIDPRNPQVLYAATWDRHRTVAALMSGGPGSGIHKSTDGGETWEELTQGLPSSNMGKIGLAISPQQPDVLYAAIELDPPVGCIARQTKVPLGKNVRRCFRRNRAALLPRALCKSAQI